MCTYAHWEIDTGISLFFPTLPPCRPWDKDRFMAPDIEAATTLLREGKVWEAVRPYIESYREKVVEPPAAKLRIVDQHKNC